MKEVSQMGGKTSTQSKAKYNSKAYDRITFVVSKGKKEEIKLFAAKRGESLNGFINHLIAREMGEIPENCDELVSETNQQPE